MPYNNYWGLGFVIHETDDWSVHFGPIDIECERTFEKRRRSAGEVRMRAETLAT